MSKSRDEVVALLEGVIAELGPEWDGLSDVLGGLVAVVRVGERLSRDDDALFLFCLLFDVALSQTLVVVSAERDGGARGSSMPLEDFRWN